MSGNHEMERARRLLALPNSWLEEKQGGYALRTGPDRRARIMLTLDETGFRALIAAPGLSPRRGGGWVARRGETSADPAPPAGRPGMIDGSRPVMQADGRLIDQPANLAPSAVAWLARRLDPDGRPWLSRAEVAAAAQLEIEARTALGGAQITMRWDALPRSGSGGAGPGDGPGDRAMAAARRMEKALAACGPARGMVEHICLRASALQAAEQALGLRRRTGRTLLKQGLTALARHYRLA